MASSFNVVMGSLNVFSPTSLLTQQTIQKSTCFNLIFNDHFSFDIYQYRILLACIKFLGECPCPRCLIKKEDVPKMGMKIDLETRLATQRVNDAQRHRKIEKARKLIFQHSIGINGQRIKKILQGESLVPTRVSNLFTNLRLLSDQFILEHIFYSISRIYF
jgi:hypothetical protein